jgi:O-antigen/teichoic acid export membrane protein
MMPLGADAKHRAVAVLGALQEKLPTVALRNFMVLVSGGAFGYVLLLTATPIITRLVSPEDMGVFGTYSSIVSVLSVIASLGFETAIITASEEDAPLLVAAATLSSAIISIAAGTILFVLFQLHIVESLPYWLPWLIVADIMFGNALLAAQYWYVRERLFRRASLGAFWTNASRGLVAIILATMLPGSLALPLASWFGRTIGLFAMDRQQIVLRSLRNLASMPSAGRRVAVHYWKSVFFLMPSTALEAAFFWLPVVLTSSFYGIEQAGYVALAQRLLGAPLSLIGRSFADVYHVRITGHTRAISVRMMRTTLVLIAAILALGMLVCAIFLIRGGAIMSIVFGTKWAASGQIFGLIGILTSFQMCGQMVTRLLIQVGRQELKFFAFIALLASIFGSFYVGYYLSWSLLKTLGLMVITGAFIFSIWIPSSLLFCRTVADD